MLLSYTPQFWRKCLPVARIVSKFFVSHAFAPGVISFFRWLIWLRRTACSPAKLVGSARSVSFSGCMADLAPMAVQAPLAPLPPLPPPAALFPLCRRGCRPLAPLAMSVAFAPMPPLAPPGPQVPLAPLLSALVPLAPPAVPAPAAVLASVDSAETFRWVCRSSPSPSIAAHVMPVCQLYPCIRRRAAGRRDSPAHLAQ